MGFRYDFDMCPIFPESEARAHASVSQKPRYIAMFRDPALVTALRNADGDVQQVFTEAGFALNAHKSDVPSGQYPAHHEAARAYFIERLTDNLRKLPKHDRRNWNGFDMAAFTQSIVKAVPIDLAPKPRKEPEQAKRAPSVLITQQSGTAPQPPQLARAVALMGLTAGTALMLFSLAGAMA